MKKSIKKAITEIENRIEALKLAKNAVSDEARAEAESTIAKFENIVKEMKDALAAAEEGDDDKSEAMKAQLAELTKAVGEIQNSLKKTEIIKNDIKSKLNDKKYVERFFNAVKRSENAREFRDNIREEMKEITNGIATANISDFLPGFIVDEINDAFTGKRHRLLELVDWTGLPMFKALWETKNDMAHMHTAGQTKTEQTLEFEPIEIRPQYVYKYVQVDQVLLRETRDMEDVLLRYVTRELLDRLLTTIEWYILTGQGPFVAPLVVPNSSNNQIDYRVYMNATSGIVAVVTKNIYFEMRQSCAGQAAFFGTDIDAALKAEMGVDEIIITDIPAAQLAQSANGNATYDGRWYIVPRDYKMVGDVRPDEYRDFNLATNKHGFLTEMYIGGGCTVPNNFIAVGSVAN